MGVFLNVAPADGWETWSEAKFASWLLKTNSYGLRLTDGTNFNLFRATILAQLEGGVSGARFPLMDRLFHSPAFLASYDVASGMKELGIIGDELATLPLKKIRSPRAIIDTLPLAGSGAEVEQAEIEGWRKARAGQLSLDPVNAKELKAILAWYGLFRPGKKPAVALDVFQNPVRAAQAVLRKGAASGKGAFLVT